MSTTTFYGFTLVDADVADVKAALDKIFAAIDAKLNALQKPAGVNQTWGDITNNRYLLVSDQGMQVVGGLNLSQDPVTNIVIEGGAVFPAGPAEKQLFVRTDVPALYIYLNGAWVVAGTVTAQAIADAGGVVDAVFNNEQGAIAVLNNLGDVDRIPGGANDGQILVQDGSEDVGWRFASLLDEYADAFVLGSLRAGSGVDTAGILNPPVDSMDFVLSLDPAQPQGMHWLAPISWLGRVFTSKGQLLLATGAGSVATLAAPAVDQVLIGDPNEGSGVKWVSVGTLAEISQTDVSAAARVYAYEHLG